MEPTYKQKHSYAVFFIFLALLVIAILVAVFFFGSKPALPVTEAIPASQASGDLGAEAVPFVATSTDSREIISVNDNIEVAVFEKACGELKLAKTTIRLTYSNFTTGVQRKAQYQCYLKDQGFNLTKLQTLNIPANVR